MYNAVVLALATSTLTWVGLIIILRKFGNSLVKNFAEGINKMLINPTVKKGFSLMGQLGGDAKAQQTIKDDMAKGFIQKNYGMLKMIAENVAGIDVDELIDKYGAENVIGAVSSFAQQLGINPSESINSFIRSQRLNTGPSESNPYERR